MSRKNAREVVFKLTFEFLFTDRVNEETYKTIMADEFLTGDDEAYIRRVYQGIAVNKEELLNSISTYARGISLERMIRADVAVLLVAIYEMKYEKDIPFNVSISEAVDITKAYSTEKSGQFVNGILASVYKELSNGNNN